MNDLEFATALTIAKRLMVALVNTEPDILRLAYWSLPNEQQDKLEKIVNERTKW